MSITRRDALKTIVVAAGAVGIFGPDCGKEAEASSYGFGFRRRRRNRFFPQSVASGDPKPESAIFWTRVVDPRNGGDLTLRFQVSTDDRFRRRHRVADASVQALEIHGGCTRVKVTGLMPGTPYYYRFIYRPPARLPVVTNTGRTRTAPDRHDPRPIRFALASCQDYIGRYFNAYLALTTPENDDLDFVCHVGDYIYETSGDPSFQSPGGERAIRFEDEEGAIPLGSGANPFFAARSISNYRQLYRTYRSDEVLQETHEKFPFICIWDDHEFTNDSHSIFSTHLDGRLDDPDFAPTARDLERKHNAEIVWLEYQPIDDAPDGVDGNILSTDPAKRWPSTKIYRRFEFGRHVNLVMTDYRSFRPDHPIPEDAFPGTVVADEPQVRAKYHELDLDVAEDLDKFRPYVRWEDDLTARQQQSLRDALLPLYRGEYASAGLSTEDAETKASEKVDEALRGLLDVRVLNGYLAPGQRIDETGRKVGLTYAMLGKAGLFGMIGARYGFDQHAFDLFATFKGVEDENVYGDDQQVFLEDALETSDATWNVVASSVSNTAMVIDLTGDNWPAVCLPGSTDPFCALSPLLRILLRLVAATPLGKRYYLTADHWDGFPNRREQIQRLQRRRGNVIGIAGDIHSSWITDHSGEEGPLYEFTGASITSTTIGGLILGLLGDIGGGVAGVASGAGGNDNAASLRALGRNSGMDDREMDEIVGGLAEIPDAGAPANPLLAALETIFFDRAPTSAFRPSLSQDIKGVDVYRNGIVVFDAEAERFRACYYLLTPEDVTVSAYGPLERAKAIARMHENKRAFVVEDGVLSEVTNLFSGFS